MRLKPLVLAQFGRDELRDLIDLLKIEEADRRSADSMRRALSHSRRATLRELLPRLSEVRVKDVCDAAGVPSVGRKSALVERLLSTAEPGGTDRTGEELGPSASQRPQRNFQAEYDLVETRRQVADGGLVIRDPAGHQARALAALQEWYSRRERPSGAILALPTGAGKTFTAVRFLATSPIADEYKVLWLAHTHHLLEQAWKALAEDMGQIAVTSGERERLRARVVSGVPGHYPVHRVTPDDDVVIGTLQTIGTAFKEEHPRLKAFVRSGRGRLAVVFDEAHHAPAPSYRRLVDGLRQACPDMMLLGLTATPTYSDERRAGWLARLFPQDIVFQATVQELMAAKVLAKPHSEQHRTSFSPGFDEREYQTWVTSFRDLPESLIEEIATNGERNDYIAQTYARSRDRYGRTVMFADRWYQCEAIAAALHKRGVSAGTVYSHVDRDPGTSGARTRGAADENTQVLEQFKSGQLDVILNVQMLTEGTDVPQAQTVFITRQTTSRIMLTQMVGRALRGPKFGGTEEAYLVFFIDDWKRLINWAHYDCLAGTAVGIDPEEYGKRPPVQWVSIELVRKLAAQMDSGLAACPVPFTTLLPVGWFRVDYVAQRADTEDTETVRRLVMVFEPEREAYDRLLDSLCGPVLEQFEAESLTLDDVGHQVDAWVEQRFGDRETHFGSDLAQDVLAVARHVAQTGQRPAYFDFAERDQHDLDRIAGESLRLRLDPYQIDQRLKQEFNNHAERYWSVLYPSYSHLKQQYNLCQERLLQPGGGVAADTPVGRTTDDLPEELADEVKAQVRQSDGACVVCGSRYRLQVDHIVPVYLGGPNALTNLQTLCSVCNRLKGTQSINFRDPTTDLAQPPGEMPDVEVPQPAHSGDAEAWRRFLLRAVCFFYRCASVHDVTIGKRGPAFHTWRVTLKPGNDPSWLAPHLEALLQQIAGGKAAGGYGAPTSLVVTCPGFPDAVYP